MPKAYSYLRFSTPEQMRGDSFRRQTQLAEQYAARHGLELDATLTFQDLGVSAFRGRNARQGALRAFLDAVEEGVIEEGSYLLVESLDRISRDTILAAQGLFLQIIQAGIVLVTLTDQRAYSAASINQNPTDLIVSLVTMMRAHDESLMKAQRLKSVWRNKRAQAADKPMSARGPGWLRFVNGQWEVMEERAKIVRRIFRMAAEGHGQNAIAKTLNSEGVPTWGDSTRKPAKHWHPTYIVKILKSPSVAGIVVPNTLDYEGGKKVRLAQEPIEGYYPPVVERELYDDVQALKQPGATTPQRGRHAAQPVRNVLGGLARCPMCGDTLTRISKGPSTKAGRPYLVCRRAKMGAGCRYRAVRCEDIERGLAANAEWITATGPVGTTYDAIVRQIEENNAEQERLGEMISRLVHEIGAGPTSPALREALARAEHSLELLKRFEADLRDRADMAEGPVLRKRLSNLRDALATEPHDVQRVNLALRMVLASVVVDYRSGLMLLRWKHGGESTVRYAEPENPDTVPERWQEAAKFLARHFPQAREQTDPAFMPRPQADQGPPLPE